MRTAPAPDPGRRGLAEWMARLRGFEPPTPSSGGWCSDPLSYRRELRNFFPGAAALPFGSGDGRGEWIRTTDPLLPKQMRYQAALRPEAGHSIPSLGKTGSAVRTTRRMAAATAARHRSEAAVAAAESAMWHRRVATAWSVAYATRRD